MVQQNKCGGGGEGMGFYGNTIAAGDYVLGNAGVRTGPGDFIPLLASVQR